MEADVSIAETCIVNVTELTQIYQPIADELDAARRMLAERVAGGFRMVGNGHHSEPYILSGKLIRPALFLLSTQLIDTPSSESSVEMAAACEMLHLASLIHDDVLDEADLRRGVPSVNALWGNRTAVLVGDWLVAEALNVLSRYGGRSAVETMLDVMKEVLAGEMMQVRLGSERVSLTKEEYFDIIRRKTASLLQVVCQLPAIADGGDGSHTEALGTYGHNFGMAYQIVDDTLDLMGSADIVGKPIGADVNNGKRTLPIIYLEETLPEGSKDAGRLRALLSSDLPDADEMAWLRQVLREHGACDQAAQCAARHVAAAKQALDPFPDSAALRSMTDLADFVTTRTF